MYHPNHCAHIALHVHVASNEGLIRFLPSPLLVRLLLDSHEEVCQSDQCARVLEYLPSFGVIANVGEPDLFNHHDLLPLDQRPRFVHDHCHNLLVLLHPRLQLKVTRPKNLLRLFEALNAVVGQLLKR